VVLSGSLTSLLRARWGLLKVRGANDRHHALDAVVVAACGHQVVQRLSTLVNAAGWAHKPEMGGYVQVDTGEFLSTRDFVNRDEVYRLFPRPWRHFRDEVMVRLNMDDPEQLRTAATQFGTYPPAAIENLHPLFVSRAPQRRNGGAVHKETIYGKARDGHVLFVKPKDAGKKEPSQTQATRHQASTEEKRNLVIERIGVMDKDVKGNYKFTLQKLENIIDPSRNELMIGALHLWLEGREEREKQAKEIEAETGRGKQKRPLTDLEQAKLEELRALPRKPLKHDPECGPFTGPIIRTVKLNAGKTTGIEIRNGIAANDSMLRVDIFAKAGKFHLVPVYVHHRVSGLPNRAIVQSKDESEWTLIDDSFQFLFSLYPNDFVKVTLKNITQQGYYAGCDRATGGVNLWVHDRNQAIGKDGLIRGIGVKTALKLEKFNVDVLGNIYPAPAESRRDLA
jgi:CRISPR-associated endonuclease Csn1